MLDINKNRDRIPPLRVVRGVFVLEVLTHNTPLPPLKGGIRSWFLLKSSILTERTHYLKDNLFIIYYYNPILVFRILYGPTHTKTD